MGLLSDLLAPNPRHGRIDAQILRRPRRSSLRVFHRRLHLVLFSLNHHNCPRRYLDGNYFHFNMSSVIPMGLESYLSGSESV